MIIPFDIGSPIRMTNIADCRCIWDEEPCPADMVQPVFTELGYCMLFNGVDKLFTFTPGIGVIHCMQKVGIYTVFCILL